ncbi:MAG: serine hydrolase [Bacteroidota bacterium]
MRLSAFLFVAMLGLIPSCKMMNSTSELRDSIEKELAANAGTFAVAFKDLQTGEELFINEHEPFHAASTMKTPVMVEVYKQAAEGTLSLNDSITIKNEFKSIVDGSAYQLTAQDDSDTAIYQHLGEKRTLYSLVYDMIIQSSNLATNIVIERVGADRVTQTLRSIGASNIKVLRGVEDSKAYQAGLNNEVTAFDLMLLFEKIGREEMVSPEASQAMIKILLDQKYNDIIPARLPEGVMVAHKTGWITGVHHDSALLRLPDGRKFVLILLSKELKDEKAAVASMAKVSEMIYEHVAAR